jgi:Ca2+-binding RTX toxin-like protein
LASIILPMDIGTTSIDILRGKITTDAYGGITNLPASGTYVYNYIFNAGDTFFGLSGNDTIIGDRYDTIQQNFGSDTIWGGHGNDTIYQSTGREDPNWATPLEGNSGDSGTAHGGSGDDTIYGGGGDYGDYIYGEANNDKLYGFGGNDYIYGGTGNDIIDGGNGNDGNLRGEDGADTIKGGAGDDYIYGGFGRDVMYGDAGNDYIDGGGSGSTDVDEFDTLTYVGLSGANDYVNVDLQETGAQDTNSGGLDTIRDIEQLIGSKGGDRLYGSDLANVIRGAGGNDKIDTRQGNDKAYGDAGNDRISGGDGNDRIEGGAGNDILNGGTGKDSLIGGTGRDRFDFSGPLTAANKDAITKFSHADDTIGLKKSVFAALGPSVTADEFYTGAGAHDGTDHIIYNKAAGTLIYDADANGSKLGIVFATIDKDLNLNYTDFLMI